MGAWMQHPLILTGVYKGVTMGKNLKAYDEVCDCMGIFDDLTGTIGMVDDDRRSLDSLERLVLEMTPGLRIAWSVIDGPRAVSLTLDARTRPDLVLVDLSMESMSGVMVCRRIRRRDSMVKLLAMTSFAKETFGFDVAQAGAQGLVSKTTSRKYSKAWRRYLAEAFTVISGSLTPVPHSTSSRMRRRNGLTWSPTAKCRCSILCRVG